MTNKEPGKRIAIVIGCNRYQSPGLNPLEFAEKDARAIQDRLANPEIGGFDKVYSFDSSSTLHDIRLTIFQVLEETRSEDKVVFYFSGHGIRYDSQLYLAINETDKKSPPITAISTRELLENLEKARAARKCVILDCCYSGAIGKKGDAAELLDFDEDLKVHQGRGVVVLTSSLEYEESLESSKHGHSLFTHYLLEGMDGAADEDEDGVITPSELYRYAFQRVKSDTDGKMSPTIPLNKLEGPEFYLVQNPRLEQKTLNKLQVEMDILMNQNHHLLAWDKLQQNIDQYQKSSSPIAQKLVPLQKQIEQSLSLKWRKYLSRLNDEWSENVISRDLKEAAEQHIKGDPEFMFTSGLPKNPLTLDLRQHFNEDIDSEALNERWPRERLIELHELQQVNKPVAKELGSIKPQSTVISERPAGDTGDKTESDRNSDSDPQSSIEKPVPNILNNLKRWSPFLMGIIVIIVVVLLIPVASNFQPEKVHLGINARNKYGDQTRTYILEEFIKELNKALIEKKSAYRLSSSVSVFENTGAGLKELAEQLDNGQIDILGELSPRQIFKLNEDVHLSPFIGPMHPVKPGDTPQDNYRTVLFGLAENYPEEIYRRKDNLILQIDQHKKKIVVADTESTSGYWWPRHWILDHLKDNQLEYSFKSISNIQSKEEIVKKVICDPDKITAGALAEFRYLMYVKDGKLNKTSLIEAIEKCSASPGTKLTIIDYVDQIPNGAYVLGPAAASQPNLANDLIDVWQSSVQKLVDRAINCSKAAHNCELKLPKGIAITRRDILKQLPEQWMERDISNYTTGLAEKVFSTEDPVEKQKSRVTFGLFLICAVILAFGLIATTLLRRSQPIAPGQTNNDSNS